VAPGDWAFCGDCLFVDLVFEGILGGKNSFKVTAQGFKATVVSIFVLYRI
jgi:hypothetical protein